MAELAEPTEHKIAEIPEQTSELKALRACMWCSQVKSLEQFEKFGCTNCDQFLHLKGHKQRVNECTSASFDGLVALMDPDSSWVARWQRITGKTYSLGLYAMSVNGRLPPEVIEDVERQNNKRYRPRS